MFISKAEKEDLFYRIGVLEQQARDLTAKVVIMSKFPEIRKEVTSKGRTWSPEQRAKASEQMKKSWVAKKQRWAEKRILKEST